MLIERETYSESASKTESIYVDNTSFHRVSFSSRIVAVLPLRDCVESESGENMSLAAKKHPNRIQQSSKSGVSAD